VTAETASRAMAVDQAFVYSRMYNERYELLEAMVAVIPWSAPCEVKEHHYPKVKNT
jgi:hypothetical protein